MQVGCGGPDAIKRRGHVAALGHELGGVFAAAKPALVKPLEKVVVARVTRGVGEERIGAHFFQGDKEVGVGFFFAIGAVTLGAVLFLNERVGIRRWVAILIGFGGVLLIVRPGAADFQIGMVYAVISVAMLALRDMLMRVIKTTLHSSSFGFYGFFAMGTAGVLIWPFSDHMIQPNAVEWVYIFVAIITAVLGYFAIIISTRIAEASTVAPYRYTRLIFSTLLAMAFLGERPDLMTWVGSAIVIASGLYTFWRERVRATGEIS